MAMTGSGDRLARGAVKAAFSMPSRVKNSKWKKAFDDFDPEKYRRDASAEKTGNAGAQSGKATSSDKPVIVKR